MERLRARIGAWHEETFGADYDKGRLERVKGKFREEAKEFLDAPTGSAEEAIEIADNIIVLLAYAHRLNINVAALVEQKFIKVSTRDQKRRDDERRERREATTL
jgi:NTP pyrophosphatase (non-canonical NTP hydrolase)